MLQKPDYLLNLPTQRTRDAALNLSAAQAFGAERMKTLQKTRLLEVLIAHTAQHWVFLHSSSIVSIRPKEVHKLASIAIT